MSSNGNRQSSGNGNGHSHEQGLRVHHLANFGGLIALAGLDLEPPDFLLGALLSVAQEARKLSAEERAQVAKIGETKLNERATGKRAWKSWQRAQDLHAAHAQHGPGARNHRSARRTRARKPGASGARAQPALTEAANGTH